MLNISSTTRVVLALVFSLFLLAVAGCGNRSEPAQALDDFVEATNDRDCDKFFEVVDYSDLEAAQSEFGKEEELERCKRMNEENPDYVSEEITGYKILEENIDGDTAELKVELTTRNGDEESTETTLLMLRRTDGTWRLVIGIN